MKTYNTRKSASQFPGDAHSFANDPEIFDKRKSNAAKGDALVLKRKSVHDIGLHIVEVKAREGIVISVLTEGDTMSASESDHVIEIPPSSDLLSPILSIIPLQLLAYHIAVRRGCDVDQPRNLAKSVTVE